MPMFTVNTHRQDPYKNFKFKVRWDGQHIAGITKVSPLIRTTEAVITRSGSDPSNEHVSPGTTSYPAITLERGVTHDTSFEQWANLTHTIEGDAAMSLKDYRKDMSIELLNLQGTTVMSFMVFRCWVSEYQALPALDANANCIAIERIVIQHEGWQRDEAVSEPTET
jgi:phage tail-like protein